MYFIPVGLMLKTGHEYGYWMLDGVNPANYAELTLSNFVFANLIPVTIGNIIGGAVLVGAVYWFVYLRRANSAE